LFIKAFQDNGKPRLIDLQNRLIAKQPTKKKSIHYEENLACASCRKFAQINSTVCGVNPDLSPHGENQAKNLYSRITTIHADIVLLSPLTRAWRTYQLSGHTAKEIVYDSRLIESNWNIPDYYSSLKYENLPTIAKPDVNNAHALPAQERVSMLLGYILASKDSSLLLVGHWGIFMFLFNEFIGSTTLISTASENTSISLLEIDNNQKRSVVFWNDTSHLNHFIK